jgi:hypothetical protein
VDHALVGAVALAVHGVPRATADIDFLVEASQVSLALDAARQRGFRFTAAPMRFADGLEIRRASKIDGEDTLTLDFLLVQPELEAVWASRRRQPLRGGEISVVSRQGLIEMKIRSGRDQDLADVRRLEELDR